MMDEEIRQALSEVREMKKMCGNINMKLTNIVTQRGQDYKKKLEAEYQRGFEDGKEYGLDESDMREAVSYQRGLEDAWNVAKKIAVETDDGGVSISALYEMFGTESMCMIMKNNTVYDAADKLKAYEEKQKHDDKIEVGDEVEWDNDFTGDRFIVTRIYQPYGKKEQCDGIDDDGDVYRAVLIESLVKTGRHFDIASILEAMKHD